MTVTRTGSKVFRGYGDIYVGALGSALPADTVNRGSAWPAGWVGQGFTDDGVEFEKSTDTTDIHVEEQLTPVDIAVTGAGFAIKFALAEDTLDNHKTAYGAGTLTTVVAATGIIGKTTLTLSDSLDTVMLGFDADNSEGFWRRFIIPRVQSVGSVSTPYKRQENRVYPVEFRAICAMTEIVIINKTAAAL